MPRKLESLFVAALILIETFVFRDFLSGKATGIGDTFSFLFPAFSFFAENLIQGVFPLWDPYTHGGHPFYPMMGIHRLMDPIALAVICFGKLFTLDLLVLFNWNLFVTSWVMLLGVYWVIRSLTQNRWLSLYFAPVLLFGTLLYSSFWHVATLFHFVWIPYIFLFLFRIVIEKDYRWRTFLLLALFTGLQGQGYFISSLLVFLLLFTIALFLFFPSSCFDLVSNRSNWLKIASVLGLITFLFSPTLILSIEQSKYVFPYRMSESEYLNLSGLEATSKVALGYSDFVSTGAVSNLWNFLWLIYPNWWGKPSEVFLSFGALTWLLAMVGIFLSQNRLKNFTLFLGLLFGLLIMGAKGGIHPVLFRLFPPVRYIRHLMELSYYFSFFFLICAAFGLEFLFNKERTTTLRKVLFSVTTLTLLIWTGTLVPSRPSYYSQLFLLLGAPVLAYFYWHLQPSSWSKSLLFISIGISLWGASDIHLREFKQLYTYFPSIQNTNIKTTVAPLSFPPYRSVSPYESLSLAGDPVASPALATRQPALFNFNSGETIESAIQNGTRTHFYLFKNYFRWIRKGVATSVLAEVFSIQKPLIDFKSSALFKEEGEFFNYLSEGEGLSYLEEGLLLTSPEDKKFVASYPKGDASISVLSYKTNSLTLRIDNEHPGFLYWSDGFDPYWQVKVNGSKFKLLQANLNFKAVPVPRGISTLSFDYQPWPFLWAIRIYYFTLLFLTYAIAASYLEKIKKPFQFLRQIELVKVPQVAIKLVMPFRKKLS